VLSELIIKDSDAFYNIIRLIKNPVYWKDNDGRYLGCNQYLLKLLGLENQEHIIGKTDAELWDPLEVGNVQWVESDQLALKNGECAIEISKTISDEKFFFALIKSRLADKNGKVIGILGFLTESPKPIPQDTIYKMNIFKDQIVAEKEHQMTQIIDLVNASIYWKDKEGHYLGCNKYVINMAGLSDRSQIIGKTDADLIWKANAVKLMEIDNNVINNGRYTGEEKITTANGSEDIYWTVKNQLIDSQGNIIGTIGTSLDIKAQKEAERLRLESERQKVTLQEQEKFAQLARKVAHDINSPLASLKMMIPMCGELPENKRTLLNRAAEGILDIANNLLSNYHKQNPDTSEVESRQHLLVSDLLIQLLSEKKMQYRNCPVTLKTAIATDAHFAFIKMQPTEFRRAMSNLINNAVDALEGSSISGKVTIHLTVDTNAVVVKIQDNGKGMTAAMVEKMQNRQSFTEGKENGHGLGLQQVWDTLEYNQGTMDVQSVSGKGTSIQLTFPRIAASSWIAQDIHLIPDNIIVILDDDESIHTAWDLRFASLLMSYPSLEIHHFTQGQAALDFLAKLSQEQKDLVVFLSDYELLQQRRNGLEVVKESGIKRARLVTSYYSNLKIREEIDRLGIKILPKQMASIIPILFINESALSDTSNSMLPKHIGPDTPIQVISPASPPNEKPAVQKAPLVLLDDNQVFADSLMFRFADSKVVTHYPDPTVFLGECEKYAKDTPICIDNNFGVGVDINGAQVAERLHALEFTRLFIVSGDRFAPGAFPEYVTLIEKTNLELLNTL